MKCGTSATSTFLRQHSKLFDMGSGFHINILQFFLKFSTYWKPVGWVKPITLIDIMIEVKNFINHLCEANLDKFYLKRRRLIIKISRLVNRYNHVINANLNFRKISQNFGVRNACEAVLNRFIAKIDMFNMLSVNISV